MRRHAKDKNRTTAMVARISRSPDELAVRARLIVGTSVLSNRWKLIWTTLPFLSFDWDVNSSSVGRSVESLISIEKYVKYASSHYVEELDANCQLSTLLTSKES
ncbi:hypothetical protein ACET3Z_001867 [Daucus carota]